VEHRWVHERETESGLVRFEAQLRHEEAAVVRRALEAADRARDGTALAPPTTERLLGRESPRVRELDGRRYLPDELR
jgi:hypothetical protein